MLYVIYAVQPPGLHLDAIVFAELLRSHWKDFELGYVDIQSSSIVLRWNISLGEYSLVGPISAEHQSITIDDSQEGVASFAAWLRSVIPPAVELYLADDSSGGEILLEIGLTADQLMKLMDSTFS
jgi:hypothetical protein